MIASKMNAIVVKKYGSPEEAFKLEQLPIPTPTGNQVLIKVCATSVNAADYRLMRADPCLMRLAFGLYRPSIKVLGADVSGIIAAIGPKVTKLKIGDEVFGDLSNGGFGAFAEYVCAAEDMVIKKPSNLSFQEAAAIPLAAITALQAIKAAGVCKGQRVLIGGASGGVGVYAIQIAKNLGAEVTAICGPDKADRMQSLGADFIINYTKENFTERKDMYDVFLDMAAFRSIYESIRPVKPNGTYAVVGGSLSKMMAPIINGFYIKHSLNKRTMLVSAKATFSDLMHLKELLEAKKIMPVIDKVYPLSEVPAAVRYVEGRNSQGKVVIKVDIV